MIKIYNKNQTFKGYLENAKNITFEKKMNSLWNASFTLPSDDDKKQ